MKEILPGIFHWKTLHEGIDEYVHSYYCCATKPAFLIDPRIPAEGLEWFEDKPPPENIYLTNRHHYRHSDQFMAEFQSKIWCHRTGLYHFTKEQKVHGFTHGKILLGEVSALTVGVLCPEETAFYLAHAGGIIAVGDAIIRNSGRLEFVSDPLLGDDPEAVKEGLIRVFSSHLSLDFQHLLFAHGAPLLDTGKLELHRFLHRQFVT